MGAGGWGNHEKNFGGLGPGESSWKRFELEKGL